MAPPPQPQLWFVNIDTLCDPSPQSSSSSSSTSKSTDEWQHCCSECLSDEERRYVNRYVLDGDKKRALTSVLLQKAMIRHHLQVEDNEDFSIARTADGKPYMQRNIWRTKGGSKSLRSIGTPSIHPHWNYNVSHHNKFVCIGSSVDRIIGVDVVDIRRRTPLMQNVKEYISFFESQLHPQEIEYILNSDNDLLGSSTDDSPGSGNGSSGALTRFFTIWALKESYIKAVGSGLNIYTDRGVSLQDCRFAVLFKAVHRRRLWGSGTLYVRDALQEGWVFEFFNVDSECSHLLAVAMGPLAQAARSYRSGAWDLSDDSPVAPLSPPTVAAAVSSNVALSGAGGGGIVDPLYNYLIEKSAAEGGLLTAAQRAAVGHASGQRDLYMEEMAARGADIADLCRCTLA